MSDFGFGIALDLGLDKLTKAKRTITKSFEGMTDSFEKSKKTFNQTGKALNRLTKEVRENASLVSEKISESKLKLAGLAVAAADASILDSAFAGIATSANLGTDSSEELLGISIKLSNQLGLSINTTKDAIQAYAEYGKTLLYTQPITSDFAKETLKTALQVEKAWGVALEDTISLFDDLYKHLDFSPTQSRKFIESVKGISKATGQGLKELIDFNKQIIDVSASLRGFITEKELLRATKFAGLLNQMGGDASGILNIFQDLQSPLTLENQAELFGQLGLNLERMRDLDVGQLGNELGIALKNANSIQKALAAQAGLGYDQQQALIRATEAKNKLTIEEIELNKDFAKVMNSLGETFATISLTGRKFFVLVMKPLLETGKPLFTAIKNINTAFIDWFGSTSPLTRALTGITIASVALSGVLTSLFVLGKSVALMWFKNSFTAKILGKVLLKTLSPALSLVTGAFTLLRTTAITAWAAVTSPVGLVVAAVAAVGVVIYKVMKNWNNVRDSFIEGLDAIYKGFTKLSIGILKLIVNPFQTMNKALTNIATAFRQVLSGDFKGAVATLGSVFAESGVTDITKGVKDIGLGIAESIVPDLKGTTEKALSGINSVFGDIVSLFKDKSEDEASRRRREEAAKNFKATNLSGLYSGNNKLFVQSKTQENLLERNNKLMEELIKTTKEKDTTININQDSGAKKVKVGAMSPTTTLSAQADIVRATA